MAVSSYESVLQLAESLSRDQQLRLIEELMRLTATSQPANDLDELFERLRRMPVRDPRSPDEIMGYDSLGLPR